MRKASHVCNTGLPQSRWPGKMVVWLQTNPLITPPQQGCGTLDRRAFEMVLDARPIIVRTFRLRIHHPRRFRVGGLR